MMKQISRFPGQTIDGFLPAVHDNVAEQLGLRGKSDLNKRNRLFFNNLAYSFLVFD
jgi:hypothetical protein